VIAHDMDYALATVHVNGERVVEMEFQCHIAAFMLEVPPGDLPPVEAELLRTMADEELQAKIARAEVAFGEALELLLNDERVTITDVEFPDPDTMRIEPGSSSQPVLGEEPPRIKVTVTLPAGGTLLKFTMPPQIGPIMVRTQYEMEPAIVQMLDAGQPCAPFVLSEGEDGITLERQPMMIAVPFWVEDTARWGALGFEHIVPLGLDHILFVIGLFLLSARFKPLLWQVTAFTLAHTATLILAYFDVVSLPAGIVEPLIAFSIAFVAVENIMTTKLHPWRPALVFAFGLIHGLGFAGALKAYELPPDNEILALVSFNVGVEVGQLACIGAAFLLVGWFAKKEWYRGRITVPASCVIAFWGVYVGVGRILTELG
jgi:hypothetical protein